MLKNWIFWMFLVLCTLCASALGIHWKGIETAQQRVQMISPLYEREVVVTQLDLAMEKYRRSSSSFRKLDNAQIASIKDHLRSEFNTGIAKLAQLEPVSQEVTEGQETLHQLDEMMKLSAMFEPQLFLHDAYQKPQIQELHQSILNHLAALNQSAESRLAKVKAQTTASSNGSVRVLGAVMALIVGLFALSLARNRYRWVIPIQKLHAYAQGLTSSVSMTDIPRGLRSQFYDVARTLREIFSSLTVQQQQRQKFIEDVVYDLEAPLAVIQSGRHLLSNSEVTRSDSMRATETLRRGLSLLSGSLGDLRDVADINRLETRLQESTVDVSELLTDVTRKLSASGVTGNIQVHVPSLPVWMKVDSLRLERVLIQALSRMDEIVSANPDSERVVEASIEHVNQGSFNGIEINIREQAKTTHGRGSVAGGPDQDLLQHWVSNKGFGMALAHKIIKAHGGSITASGVKGSSVRFTIRLPRQRLVEGLISPAGNQNSNLSSNSEMSGSDQGRLV